MLVTALVLLSFLCLLGIYNFIRKLRLENLEKRAAVLRSLGASGAKRVVGYFHPYWYVAHSSCRLHVVFSELLILRKPSQAMLVVEGNAYYGRRSHMSR